jgi:hypothetical protein
MIFFWKQEFLIQQKSHAMLAKNFIQIPNHNFTINDFIQLNPYAIVNYKRTANNSICYYGKILNSSTLDDFAKQIGSDVALIWDGITAEVSNSNLNNQHTFLLVQSI